MFVEPGLSHKSTRAEQRLLFFRAFPNAIFARRSFSEVGKNCNLNPPPLWAKLQTAGESQNIVRGSLRGKAL